MTSWWGCIQSGSFNLISSYQILALPSSLDRDASSLSPWSFYFWLAESCIDQDQRTIWYLCSFRFEYIYIYLYICSNSHNAPQKKGTSQETAQERSGYDQTTANSAQIWSVATVLAAWNQRSSHPQSAHSLPTCWRTRDLTSHQLASLLVMSPIISRGGNV